MQDYPTKTVQQNFQSAIQTKLAKQMFLIVFLCLCFYATMISLNERQALSPHSTGFSQPLRSQSPEPKVVPSFKVRAELADILTQENMKVGVEVGVQYGLFAQVMLKRWNTCKSYTLVDPWAHQTNYKDSANVLDDEQEKRYQSTLDRLKDFKDKINVCRDFSTSCAPQFADNSLDFVYIDARHDRKGVWEDLVAFWPKVREGGILAGHDYMDQQSLTDAGSLSDWKVNYDGTIDEEGLLVKGAVDDFCRLHNRQVQVGYREAFYNTWAIRK